MAKVFDDDGLVRTSIEYDESEGRTIIGSHQNVQPILDDVAARNNDGTGGYSKSRDLRMAARIPAALMDEWMREAMREGIPIHHKEVKNKFLRKKLVEYNKLVISGKTSGRVGYSNGYGNAMNSAGMLKADTWAK